MSEWSFALPLHSPLQNPLNEKLVEYREREVISELLEEWYGHGGGCGDNTFKSTTPINSVILSGLYVLMGGVAVGSLLLLLLEVVYVTVVEWKENGCKGALFTALIKRFAFHGRVLFGVVEDASRECR